MRELFIFLDLDDTILDFQWAEQRSLAAALKGVGIEMDPALHRRYREINCRQWELLEEGKLSREEVLVSRFEILFRERGIQASAQAVCDAYESSLAVGHRFMPGAEEALRELAGKHRLYLASNGSAPVQAARIRSAGLAPLLDGIFISAEIGADKPSLAYFERCFAQIPGFARDRAIIVGDSLTSDIRGGLNAGIKTCWYDPWYRPERADIVPNYTIRHMKELPSLLSQISERGVMP